MKPAGTMRPRAELDATPAQGDFARRLEAATLRTIEGGEQTGDLARLAVGAPVKILDSWEFVDAVAGRL